MMQYSGPGLTVGSPSTCCFLSLALGYLTRMSRIVLDDTSGSTVLGAMVSDF